MKMDLNLYFVIQGKNSLGIPEKVAGSLNRRRVEHARARRNKGQRWST